MIRAMTALSLAKASSILLLSLGTCDVLPDIRPNGWQKTDNLYLIPQEVSLSYARILGTANVFSVIPPLLCLRLLVNLHDMSVYC